MTRPTARIALEWLLHAVAAGLIAVLLWRSLNPPSTSRSAGATDAELPDLLPQWTLEGSPDSADLRLRRAPTPAQQDWLVALRRAGTSVTWSADSMLPALVSAEPVVDPAGGVMVRVGTPDGVSLQLADDAGVIDSARSMNSSALFRVASLAGSPVVTARGHEMRAVVADAVQLKRILVLGRVGWEAKFTIAALEERGWQVDTRLMLSPTQSITQGATQTIDTSRYSAVIVLDSAGLTSAAAILRYVGNGGGVIVAGNATRLAAFSALLPGRAGNRIVPRQRLIDTSDAEGARHAIVALKADAIVLQRDDSIVTVAARRTGAGRVIQLAEEETWRQRMRREEGSVDAHREWWARVAGSVAYAPRTRIRELGAEAAPVANLFASLGPPSERGSAKLPAKESHPERWLFAILSIALLAEWASRRARGAA